MRASIIAIACVMSWAGPAGADDFPWFHQREYEGWVEDTGTGKAKVKVLPFVLGPDARVEIQTGAGVIVPGNFGDDGVSARPEPPPRPELTPDGRLKFSYKIVRDSGLPATVRTALGSQTGIPRDRLEQATVEYVRATYQAITLEIGDVVFETKSLGGGQVSGDVAGAFYVPATRTDLLASLRAGNYRLILDYSYPVAEYSSLKLDMTTTAVSNAWVKAFREVVRSKSTSGGKFLFFDFANEVSRVHVRERLTSRGSSTTAATINVELRSPTPEQRARMEAVLGFAKQSLAETIERHQAAFNAAKAAHNPTLANAHEKYLQDLNTSTPDTSQQLIAALAKLEGAEPLAFMAAGFQMRSGDASSFYRYDGAYATTQTTTAKTQYSEYVITTTVVNGKNFAFVEDGAMIGAAIERAFDRVREKAHVEMFGTPLYQPLTAQQWSQALLKAIEARDIEHAGYAFNARLYDIGGKLDPNMVVDGSKNRLLHYAVRSGNVEIARLLLDHGASPLRRNLHGDTALDVASDANDEAMRAAITPHLKRSGKVTIAFRHEGLTLVGGRFLAPEEIAKLTPTIGATSSTIAIEDYPMMMQASLVLVVQLRVSAADYPQIRFNHRVLGMNESQRWIETQIYLDRSYRIRDGKDQTYREAIRFVGWDVGFAAFAE